LYESSDVPLYTAKEKFMLPKFSGAEKTVVVAAVKSLKASVDVLLALYEANPDLNDVQPFQFSENLPMSLDEWSVSLGVAVEEWKGVATVEEVRSGLHHCARCDKAACGIRSEAFGA